VSICEILTVRARESLHWACSSASIIVSCQADQSCRRNSMLDKASLEKQHDIPEDASAAERG